MKPNTVFKKGPVATMDEIRAVGIKGNAFEDMPAMRALDLIIMNLGEPTETRAEALNYLNNDIMGLGLDYPTEDDLKNYVTEASDGDL